MLYWYYFSCGIALLLASLSVKCLPQMLILSKTVWKITWKPLHWFCWNILVTLSLWLWNFFNLLQKSRSEYCRNLGASKVRGTCPVNLESLNDLFLSWFPGLLVMTEDILTLQSWFCPGFQNIIIFFLVSRTNVLKFVFWIKYQCHSF